MISVNFGISSMLASSAYASARTSASQLLNNLASGYQVSALSGPAAIIASTNLRSAMATIQADSETLSRAYNQANVAEGALTEISTQLSEARGLAMANASGGLTEAEVQANQLEIDAILANVDRLAASTSYSGTQLLDGTFTLSAASAAIALGSVDTDDLGAETIDGTDYTLAAVRSGADLDTSAGRALDAVEVIDAAIHEVAAMRGQVGSFQADTVAAMQSSLDTAYTQIASADSIIRDTDFALALAELSRQQVLSGASIAMLQTSAKLAENVVSLLRA